MGRFSQVYNDEQPTRTKKDPHGVFTAVNDFFEKAPTDLLGGPGALAGTVAGSTIKGAARPLVQWLTDRVVGGGSMLSGPVSKITQVPVRDILVRSVDHPDAVNPTKVTEIQSLLSSAPSRVPAVELVQEGGKFILKDGRHRFTAAQGLGLQNIPAIIAK